MIFDNVTMWAINLRSERTSQYDFILDGSVCEIAEVLKLKNCYIMITCLDSEFFETPMLLNVNQLHEVKDGFFYGFDEMWVFNKKPDVSNIPPVSLVLPQTLNQEKIDILEKWMDETGCFLGFGDGEGVNVISNKETLQELDYDIFKDN